MDLNCLVRQLQLGNCYKVESSWSLESTDSGFYFTFLFLFFFYFFLKTLSIWKCIKSVMKKFGFAEKDEWLRWPASKTTQDTWQSGGKQFVSHFWPEAFQYAFSRRDFQLRKRCSEKPWRSKLVQCVLSPGCWVYLGREWPGIDQDKKSCQINNVGSVRQHWNAK